MTSLTRNPSKEELRIFFYKKGYKIFHNNITDMEGKNEFGRIEYEENSFEINLTLNRWRMAEGDLNYIREFLRLRNIIDQEEIQYTENIPRGSITRRLSEIIKECNNLGLILEGLE
ncbi:MAG: hypothetical protein ABIB79_01175 [archaeon]